MIFDKVTYDHMIESKVTHEEFDQQTTIYAGLNVIRFDKNTVKKDVVGITIVAQDKNIVERVTEVAYKGAFTSKEYTMRLKLDNGDIIYISSSENADGKQEILFERAHEDSLGFE